MTTDQDLSGQVLRLGLTHHFRLGEVMGEANYRSVWRATWEQNGISVAVKTVRRERMQSQDRSLWHRWPDGLLREAEQLRQLRHGHVLRSIHHDRHFGLPVLVLEEIHESLLGHLETRANKGENHSIGLPLLQALEWLRQVAGVLAALHRAGIRHLDLKPANLLLTFATALGQRIKIAEFGECKDGPDSQQHHSGGTLGWLVPEQIVASSRTSSGRYLYRTSARSDVYVLGLLLFHLATGRRTELALRQRQLLIPKSPYGEHMLWRERTTLTGELSRRSA